MAGLPRRYVSRRTRWTSSRRRPPMATTAKKTGSARRRQGAQPDEADRDLYLRMFRMMALHRAVEDRMVSMYRHGELLGSLYTGYWHEAIAVGTAATLLLDDFSCPTHHNLVTHTW